MANFGEDMGDMEIAEAENNETAKTPEITTPVEVAADASDLGNTDIGEESAETEASGNISDIEGEPADENAGSEAENAADEAETAADEAENTEADAPVEQANEETADTQGTEEKPKKKINFKKIGLFSGITILALGAVYLAGSVYYTSHFFYGTHIGSYDCSNMTPQEAEAMISNELDNYSFTFYEKGDKTETIEGDRFYFAYSPIGDLSPLLEKQNPYLWVKDMTGNTLPLEVEVSYDNDALYNCISEMDFMSDTRENMTGSVQYIKYEDGQYTVEDDGTKDIVSLNNVYHLVQPKIYDLYTGMSLEKEGCYEGLAGDDNMKGVLNMLNQYVGTKVTYLRGDESTVLDGETINEWLSVSDDYIITIDAEKARAYVNELAKSYDSVGKERTFKTTGGSEIKISGGSYGWMVNNQQETEELLNIIRSGETVEREPVYKQKAAVHGGNNIGNTYVEVSIGGQHMWYYKNGECVVSSDCVTGNTSLGRGTHTGVYFVKYKDKNVTLKGEGYETPVTFWMPFNGGEGLHDALWRGAFGGSIFRGNGSHGCVNLPYGAAQSLYQNVSPGDPVVIY